MMIVLLVATAVAAEPTAAPPPSPAPEAATDAAAEGTKPPPEPEPTAATVEDAPPESQPAPEEGKALQGQPLPEAPPRIDPGTLDRHAWRGTGFFQIHVGAIVPLGGRRPGAGTVASAGGGVQLGWRVRPILALGVGLTTFLHDHAETLATDSVGNTVEVRDFGRMTVFDPLFVRFFVPTKRRIEPRFDVGALLGTYRPPIEGSPQLAGGIRAGAGLDVWIGPSFSLDFGVDPRLLIVDGRAGVSLQAGMGATVHW